MRRSVLLLTGDGGGKAGKAQNGSGELHDGC